MSSTTESVFPAKRKTVGSTRCRLKTRCTACTTIEISQRPAMYSTIAPTIWSPTLAALSCRNVAAAVQFMGYLPCTNVAEVMEGRCWEGYTDRTDRSAGATRCRDESRHGTQEWVLHSVRWVRFCKFYFQAAAED